MFFKRSNWAEKASRWFVLAQLALWRKLLAPLTNLFNLSDPQKFGNWMIAQYEKLLLRRKRERFSFQNSIQNISISVWYKDHTGHSGDFPRVPNGLWPHNHLQCFLTDAAALSQHAALHSRLPHVSIIGVMRGSQLEGEGGWEWSGSQFLARITRITKAPQFLASHPFIKNVIGQILDFFCARLIKRDWQIVMGTAVWKGLQKKYKIPFRSF